MGWNEQQGGNLSTHLHCKASVEGAGTTRRRSQVGNGGYRPGCCLSQPGFLRQSACRGAVRRFQFAVLHGGNHIYSVVKGVAHLNVVQKGDTEGNQVRILSGLTGDETVVIDNQGSLYDGASIAIR